MFLQSLELQGLKCYGPGTTTWTLDGQSHVIVGPANAGKSTLASAISSALSGSFSPADFYSLSRPAKLSIMGVFKPTHSDALEMSTGR